MQKGIRGDIIELLENRFQAVDGIEEIIDMITEIDELRKIFRMAITVESLEAFKNLILKMKDQ